MIYDKVEPLNGMMGARVGAKVAVSAHGRLPYHINFVSEIMGGEEGCLLSLRATGNLTGAGTWRLTPIGQGTRVTFERIVEADRLISLHVLRGLSVICPMISDNFQNWCDPNVRAMRQER